MPRSIDRSQRAAHAVTEDAELFGPGLTPHASRGTCETRKDGVPVEISIFWLRHSPVEAPDIEAGTDQRLDETCTGTQIEHVPAIDQRWHEQERSPTPLRRTESIQRRSAFEHERLPRGLRERRCWPARPREARPRRTRLGGRGGRAGPRSRRREV